MILCESSLKAMLPFKRVDTDNLAYKSSSLVRSKGKMHMCEVVSKDDDKVTIKRCKDGRKIQISSISYKKIKNKSNSS